MVGSLSTERNNCEPFQVNRVPRVRAVNIKASASFSSLLVFVHIIDTFFTVFFFLFMARFTLYLPLPLCY